MKKLILATLLASALTVPAHAANEDYEQYTGSMHYVSSYSMAAIYRYYHAGERFTLSRVSGDTGMFCGISTLSNPVDFIGLGSIYNNVTVTAPTSDIYLGTCIKESGVSGDNLIIFSPAADKRSRSVEEEADPALVERLESYVSGM